MIGKKNVVFGFLFLVLTAALGPYMVITQLPAEDEAQTHKQAALSRLELLAQSNYDDPQTLEKLSAEQIAKENTAALLAINKQLNASEPVDAIKGGPHAHGNLESLLNIVAGVVLCFIALKPLFKQIISWVFILGTLLHSGVLYLAVIFQQGWAGKLLATGIGPVLVLAGLLLMGIAAAIGFKGEVVRD